MSPPLKKRLLASPAEWLLHARSDLKLAKLGLKGKVLPEQICFHSQQAVEKALKSALLFHKIDFPFTHDIQELLDTLESAKIPIPSELQDVDVLTPYAVETRYPGYWGEISDSDVTEAIMLAEKTIKWASKFVKK